MSAHARFVELGVTHSSRSAGALPSRCCRGYRGLKLMLACAKFVKEGVSYSGSSAGGC